MMTTDMMKYKERIMKERNERHRLMKGLEQIFPKCATVACTLF